MTSKPLRASRWIVRLALAAAVAAFGARGAIAQANNDFHPFWAVVTADEVFVRSGPADSYYPFGKVKQGDLVRVVDEKNKWARVWTTGRAFRDFYGYIIYDETQSGVFRLDESGRKGRTLGSAQLRAPNLNTSFRPRHNWKTILQLEPDTELDVLETITMDRQIVHKVVLPDKANGWIAMSLLEPATPEQVAAWTGPKRPVESAPDSEPAVADAGQTNESPGRVLPTDERSLSMGPANAAGSAQRGQAATPDEVAAEPGAGSGAITRPAENRPEELQAPQADPEAGTEPAEKTPEDRLRALDDAYKLLRREPIETAEVQPLRQLYLDLAAESREEHSAVARYAEKRAEQLAIWADLQAQHMKLGKLRKRLELTGEEAEAVRIALETGGAYVAVGRLAASTIYDGQRLPKLFRIQDPSTGRTIAYLRPSEEFDLESMLDQVVGVAGEKRYDGVLRLNLIRAARIDLLAPHG